MNPNEPKVYIGNALHIELECGEDISAASSRQIKLHKPDGTEATLSATALGTTSIQADTVIDQVGIHLLQARLVMAAGPYLGETVRLDVFGPYQ